MPHDGGETQTQVRTRNRRGRTAGRRQEPDQRKYDHRQTGEVRGFEHHDSQYDQRGPVAQDRRVRGFGQAYLYGPECGMSAMRRAGGAGVLCRDLEALRELRAAGPRGVPRVRGARHGRSRTVRRGAQAAVGRRGAASSHRCRNAGFDSAGLAAARSVRKCGGAEFRAAGRTGGRGEASDYGDRA